MKPSRVFINDNGYFSLEWYVKGQSYSNKKSLRLVADVSFEAGNPDWWKKSKYAKAIREQKKTLDLSREFDELDIPVQFKPFTNEGPTLYIETLLHEYNDVMEEEKDKREERTLEHRLYAVRFFIKFLGNMPVNTVTRTHALTLRREAKKAKYEPKSIKGYFTCLSSIFKYAKREGYTKANPFEGISVKVTQKEPRRVEFDSEMQSFAFIYQTKRPLFDQLLFERLTGFRVTEICNYKREQIKEDVLMYWNKKAQRWEIMPKSDAMRMFLEMLPDKGEGFLFEYRSRRTLAYYAQRAAEFSGNEHIQTHQLKRNYSQEIDEFCPDERVFDALMHHAPKSNVIAVTHYSGRNIKRMLDVLQQAQARWIPFLKSLKDLKDLSDKYHYSNGKGKVKHPMNTPCKEKGELALP